ncbi:MAG: OB-fold nucleic acid binding domain-containing protein, partial [Bryobacteraceae bacterium]
MGIRVLPPDVNSSDWNFTPDMAEPDRRAIRFGLGAIKNVGRSAVEAIQRARQSTGRFRSLYQFCERVDLSALNRRMLESLIKSGAMDSLGGARAQLFAAIERAMECGQRAHRDRESGQAGLFALSPSEEEAQDRPLPQVPEWSLHEKLAGEKEMLGFYVTGHPLDQYKDKVSELATHDSSALEGLEKGAEVALCGILTGVQRKRNKEGKPWASLQLDDVQGTVEGLVFTTNYERLQAELVEDRAVLVKGSVLPEDNAAPKVSVLDIVPLDVARVALPSLISIRVHLSQVGLAASLAALFERKTGDTHVRLRLEKSRDFAVILDIDAKVRPDKEFRAEIERLCGPDSLEILAN